MERRRLRRVLIAGVFLVVTTVIVLALRAQASAHARDLFEGYVSEEGDTRVLMFDRQAGEAYLIVNK